MNNSITGVDDIDMVIYRMKHQMEMLDVLRECMSICHLFGMHKYCYDCGMYIYINECLYNGCGEGPWFNCEDHIREANCRCGHFDNAIDYLNYFLNP